MKKISTFKLSQGLGGQLRIRLSFCLCLLMFVCGISVAGAAQDDALREATDSFLELLDAGNYTQAWWEGSELLHLTSGLDEWVREQRITRELLGDFKQRGIRNIVERGRMPGLPDGDYRIIVIDSHFERKQQGLEMVVLRKDPYVDWRVVSYRLR